MIKEAMLSAVIGVLLFAGFIGIAFAILRFTA